MKGKILLILFLGFCHLAHSQDIKTFSDIKKEIEEATTDDYEVKAEYNTDFGMYILSKPTYMQVENKQIEFVESYLFESKMPDEAVSKIISTIVLEDINHLIKHFNEQYVKREGKLIWDDYRDDSTLFLEIVKDERIAMWYWKFN